MLSLNSSGTGHQLRGEVAFWAAQMGNGKEHESRGQKDPGSNPRLTGDLERVTSTFLYFSLWGRECKGWSNRTFLACLPGLPGSANGVPYVKAVGKL